MTFGDFPTNDFVTIQGLKDTIEKISGYNDHLQRLHETACINLADSIKRIEELEKQVSKLDNELSWANEPFCY